MWRGPPIAVNGSHPCKSLSCQLNNRLLNVQLFSFHTVTVHAGREKSGRNDLTKAECQVALSLATPTSVIPQEHFCCYCLEGLG